MYDNKIVDMHYNRMQTDFKTESVENSQICKKYTDKKNLDNDRAFLIVIMMSILGF